MLGYMLLQTDFSVNKYKHIAYKINVLSSSTT